MKVFLSTVGNIWAALVMLFMMSPILIIILVSVSDSPLFALPTAGLSLRWYKDILQDQTFLVAFWTSVQIAAISTALALILGVGAAIALVIAKVRFREAIITFLVSPLVVPSLVIGIAVAQLFRTIGLYNSYLSLVIAHVVITLPYVMRTLVATLSLFDHSLLDAAQTLGCNYRQAVTRVLLPNIVPAIITAGTFAFLSSFDNYAISLFIVDVATKTLPIQMLQYLEMGATPALAAISCLILLVTTAGLLIIDRFYGLQNLRL